MSNRLQTSVHGRKLGISTVGNLVAQGLAITSPAADVSITVSAEGASVANRREITIQFKDANGKDLAERATALLLLLGDANGDTFATGTGSTGIAVGTDGAIEALSTKCWIARSEADGDLDLTWLDTGTQVAFLGVLLPTGRLVVSSALTNT